MEESAQVRLDRGNRRGFANPAVLYTCAFLLAVTGSYHLYRTSAHQFREGHNVPCCPNLGLDLRLVLGWERALSEGMDEYRRSGSNYPPLMVVMYWPLSLLSDKVAYRLFAVILQATLLFSIGCLIKLWRDDRSIFHSPVPGPHSTLLWSVVLWAVFNHTYPVVFSLERGNSDIIALGFASAFLLALERERYGLATACLVMATQIKVYPAILVFLLLNRAGWKQVLWFAGLNAVALFALGWDGIVIFLNGIRGSMDLPYVWAGNHSLHSYLQGFEQSGLVLHSMVFQGAKIALLMTFTALWLFDALRQRTLIHFSRMPIGESRPYTLFELALVGMAAQIMCLLPGTSHDYKLVIQILPTLLLVGGAAEFANRAGSLALAFVVGLGLINGWILGPYQWKTPALLAAFLGYLVLGILAMGSNVARRAPAIRKEPAHLEDATAELCCR